MKKAIIIGASSGIGKELALVLAMDGYALGLAARRQELLEDLKNTLNTKIYTKYMDVSDCTESMKTMEELISEMDGVDLVIISAGTGFINKDLDWDKEKNTIDVNVSGFSALANVAMKHFLEKKSGHLVAISSIASLISSGEAPAYGATKAFMSSYLSALRKKCRMEKTSITITEIQPGFVDTEMAKGEGLFWVAPVEKAVKQIYKAIKKKKKRAFITKRWALIGNILKFLPL